MKKVVNAIIFNKDKFLIIKRKQGLHKGLWAFPGGSVEKNETNKQALIREIREEVNLEISSVIRKIADYNYKDDYGQDSHGESFLVKVKDFDVTLNNEVADYRWITIEELENFNHVRGIDEEALIALYGKL